MLNVKDAFRIAAKWTRASSEEDRLDTVVVEAARVWATDGHRAIILPVEAKPAEIGVFYSHEERRSADFTPTNSDVVVPDLRPDPVTVISRTWIDRLRVPFGFIRPRTYINLHLSRFGGALAVTAILSQAAMEKAARTRQPPPHYDFVLPGAPTAEREFAINAQYLLDAIDALGFTADQDIKLYQKDDFDPIRIDGPNGTAVVMPVRI